MSDIIFIVIAVFTVAFAVMAVGFKSTLYNAFSLMACLLGVAGIFVFLSSEFLAIMEIIVYVGAIAIAIIFAIMFSPPHFMTQPARKWTKTGRSLAIASLFFFSLYNVAVGTHWVAQNAEGDFSVQNLGKVLLSSYTLPFEVISIILFIAILGALLMAKKRGSNE